MPLIVLLLGAIATFNPFIGLILILTYFSLSIRRSHVSPIRQMPLFFIIPVMMGVLMRSEQGVIVVVSDAVLGVGLPALFFLYTLTRKNLAKALVNSSLLIVIYGIARSYLFGYYLITANKEAVAGLAKVLPQMMQNLDMQRSLSLMERMLPASWTVPQVVALFLGFIVFMNLSGIKFSWRNLSLPKYYNFFVLAALPMYFMPQMSMVFINTLVSLCVILVIQGIGVILHFTTRYASNTLVLILVSILILLNLVLVALLGFADIWLDLRKLNTKGIIYENHTS